MKITDEQIHDHNNEESKLQQRDFSNLSDRLSDQGVDAEALLDKIASFQVAIPSWALGAGGTRFARFPVGGEPGNLEEKIADVGLLHALNASCGAISLHIPWDIPDDIKGIRQLADKHELKFDAVNSNTFQDQDDQKYSYKFGSLSHTDEKVRQQAIDHNKQVIDYGEALGSKAITIWLADGTNFPGQHNFRKALERTHQSLRAIYGHLPEDWQMLIEYKPYEPNFYSTVIPDWGTSHLLADKLGPKAKTLVDLGHHLPNTNIEQIVAILLMEDKMGGFHFNDSKYGDDDLTTGSVNPYQLFLTFNELVGGTGKLSDFRRDISWMIDAIHNIKDALEVLLLSVEAIKLAFARTLRIDRVRLQEVRAANDPVAAQE